MPAPQAARSSPPAVGPTTPLGGSGTPPPDAPGNRSPYDHELSAECSLHLQRLARAVTMYGVDYDGHLPIARRWCDGTYPYVMSKGFYRCPAKPDIPGYAFNRNLDGARTRDGADQIMVVMLFDSSAGAMNAADTGESLCEPPRHLIGNSIGYLDGHVALCGPHSGPPVFWK